MDVMNAMNAGEEFDPFSMGGYAEEDSQAEEMREGLQQFPSSRTERQGSLFKFVLQAIERKEKADG